MQWGGIKDTVIDLDADPERATGLLVPPRDAFALARTIIRASELDEETLKRLRENGKRRAREDFTWEKACRRYLSISERCGQGYSLPPLAPPVLG